MFAGIGLGLGVHVCRISALGFVFEVSEGPGIFLF